MTETVCAMVTGTKKNDTSGRDRIQRGQSLLNLNKIRLTNNSDSSKDTARIASATMRPQMTAKHVSVMEILELSITNAEQPVRKFELRMCTTES